MKEFFVVFFILAYFVGLLWVVIFDFNIYWKDIVMWIKQMGKSIKGAGFSKAEKEAIENEVREQLQTSMGKLELDAMILWILHEHCGFGPTRLERFYKEYIPAVGGYLADCRDGEEQHEYTKKLAEYGIDISKWYGNYFTDLLMEYGKVQEEESDV